MSNLFGGGTLIADTDNLVLWAVLAVITAISIFLEQRFKWAEKLSAPVIAIIIGLILTNVSVLPASSGVYTATAVYFIPVSMAMMLFSADVKRIIKDSGRMFLCMNVAAVCTMAGAIVAFLLLQNAIPEAAKLAGANVGAFVGGTANFVAVSSSTGLDESLIASGSFSVNAIMTLFIIVLLWIPSSDFFKKRYPHPYQEELEKNGKIEEGKTLSASFWGRNEMSLLDLAKTVATAFVMVVIATKLAGFFGSLLAAPEGSGPARQLPVLIFGNTYVMLTIVAIILVGCFPKYFANLKGSNEVATFMMYMYFVVIGCSVDLRNMAASIPIILLFSFIIATANAGGSLAFGKLFKSNIEDITIASNASLGGPFTAAAMAISKGYNKCRVPALLCGIWGNTIGTILGIVIFVLLKTFA